MFAKQEYAEFKSKIFDEEKLVSIEVITLMCIHALTMALSCSLSQR